MSLVQDSRVEKGGCVHILATQTRSGEKRAREHDPVLVLVKASLHKRVFAFAIR